MHITAEQNGQTVNVAVNQRFAVELVGVPTAGYVWTADANAGLHHARGRSHRQHVASAKPAWLHRRQSLGSADVLRDRRRARANWCIEQRRPWETNEPASADLPRHHRRAIVNLFAQLLTAGVAGSCGSLGAFLRRRVTAPAEVRSRSGALACAHCRIRGAGFVAISAICISRAMSELLRDLWYFAATSRELKRGEMFRREILGEPVLLGRDERRARVCAARYLPAPRRAALGGAHRRRTTACRRSNARITAGATARSDGVCKLIPSLVDGQPYEAEPHSRAPFPDARSQRHRARLRLRPIARFADEPPPPPEFGLRRFQRTEIRHPPHLRGEHGQRRRRPDGPRARAVRA